MKQSLFFLIALLAGLGGYSQSLSNDSTYAYYVHLKDGSTLYARKLELRSSFTQGKYLLLDNNQKVLLSQAKDFNGSRGTYAIGNLGGQYDAYKLETEGPRISLYSQCYYVNELVYASGPTDPAAANFGGAYSPTEITAQAKAFYFRKNDGDIQRLTFHNLKLAMADDPASLNELKLAHVNLYLGIGLAATGIALMTAGIIHTSQQNRAAQNAFNTASQEWFNSNNPNAPMPTAPHLSGLSGLFFAGMATTFTAIIPFANIGKHIPRALRLYNGAQ